MKRLVTTVFLIILNTKSFAQTAVPFLQIPPDARHSAMGGIGVATLADASANFYNPAKLAFSDRTFGGNITRFSWLKNLVDGMYVTNISGYYKPKSGNQTIGFLIRVQLILLPPLVSQTAHFLPLTKPLDLIMLKKSPIIFLLGLV